MASVKNAKKEPSKRVRMAKALRSEMAPFMRSHGFDHPPREKWYAGVSLPRADAWVRVKDGREQGVNLTWLRHEARFGIEWYSETLDREFGRCALFAVNPHPPLIAGLPGGLYGGWTWSVPRTVRLAMRRLGELVTYFDGGPRSRCVNTVDPSFSSRTTPGYWEALSDAFPADRPDLRGGIRAWERQWRDERIKAFRREDAAEAARNAAKRRS